MKAGFSNKVPLIIWAALLLVFLIIQPHFKSFLFWLLIIPCMIFGGIHMATSRRDDKQEQKKINSWKQKLESVVDNWDVDDDGHLLEWFDNDEWVKIYEELKRMPKGSRSLKTAIKKIDPEFDV